MAKKLFKNIGFLTISQAANYLIPLVTIPYITRVVGPENYGSIEFATVVMLYFSAVVLYGFSFTATRKIAESHHDPAKVSRIFSAAMQARMLLFTLSAVAFLLCIYFVPTLREMQKPLLFAFPIVLGWALYPDFLFQGLEKLKVVAMANLAIKVLAAVFIFVLLQHQEDYYFVLAINGGAQVLVATATLLYAFKSVKKLKWQPPKKRLIVSMLRNGWYIFLSHFFTRVYTFGIIVFLGFMLSDRDLGLFSAAMKLVIVGQSFLFMPLGGALFPYFAKLLKTDKAHFKKQRQQIMGVMFLISLVATIVVVAFPGFFVTLLFGQSYIEIIPYMQLMMPILIITTFSHFASKQGLILLKKDGLYLKIVVATGLVSLGLNYVLITEFALWGAAWAKLGVELFLAVSSAIAFNRAWKKISWRA